MTQQATHMQLLWKSVPFGLAAGLSLALVLWFAGFVADRTGGLTWAFLFVGLAGSLALALYVLVRWIAGLWFDRTSDRAAQAIAEVQAKLDRTSTEPLTRDDIRAIPAALSSLVPDAFRLLGMVMAVLMLMGIMVQIVALGNGAVMYLQAKRLEEQNKLLGEQNLQLGYDFLREWLVNRVALEKELGAVGDYVDGEGGIGSSVVSPLSILPQFLDQTLPGVMSEDLKITLCNDSDRPCGPMTVDEFLEMVYAGQIEATASNLASIEGFHRLFLIAEQVGIVLLFDAPDSTPLDVSKDREKLLGSAATTCSSLAGLDAANLWRGVAGTGYAAMQSWELAAGETITPGYVKDLPDVADRANFLGAAAGLGILMQISGSDEVGKLTAEGAAGVLSAGLVGLRDRSATLIDDCRSASGITERAFFMLEEQSKRILGPPKSLSGLPPPPDPPAAQYP
ncbi:MAG: hypothetical protein ACT4OK_08460 [Gemmobacter sp.]